MLDTNIVLDLFVYDDPAVRTLQAVLSQGEVGWHATGAMREELVHVLAYDHIDRRLAQGGRAAGDVLAQFDRYARMVPPAPRAGCVCKDPDDQKFIDLAVALGACLLSKDKAVLRLRGRLARLGVSVQRQWPVAATLPG